MGLDLGIGRRRTVEAAGGVPLEVVQDGGLVAVVDMNAVMNLQARYDGPEELETLHEVGATDEVHIVVGPVDAGRSEGSVGGDIGFVIVHVEGGGVVGNKVIVSLVRERAAEERM